MYGADKTFIVQANGQLMRAAAYGPMIIAYRNGNPVRLDEVAHVYDGVENDKSAAWYRRRSAPIYLAIQKQPGTNIVAGGRRRQGAAADLPRRSCRRRSSLDVRTDRSGRHPRVGRTTSSSRCC